MAWLETFKHLSTYAFGLLAASILNLILRAIFPPEEDIEKYLTDSPALIEFMKLSYAERGVDFAVAHRQRVRTNKATMFFGSLFVAVLICSFINAAVPSLARIPIWASVLCIVMSQVIPWIFCTAPLDNGRPRLRWKRRT